MLLARFEKPLEIYLGSTCLGFQQSEGKAVWLDYQTPAEVLNDFGKQLVRHKNAARNIRVWLSGALARPFLVPPDSGAQNAEEHLLLARALATQSTGLVEPIEIWAAQAKANAPTLAVAMPAGVLKQLQTSAAAANVRLISVRPWWNQVFDHFEQLAATPFSGAINQVKWRSRLALLWKKVHVGLGYQPSQSEATAYGPLLWTLAESDALTVFQYQQGQIQSTHTELPIEHDPGWIFMQRRLFAGQSVGDAYAHRFTFERHLIWPWSLKALPPPQGQIPKANETGVVADAH